jgi:hypothetical protein
MGFYGPIVTKDLKAQATFAFTGLGHTVGALAIHVEGLVQNYTSGFELVRDEKFVGGLRYNLMGFSGPVGSGDSPFRHEQAFDLVSEPPKEIVIASGDQTIKVPVRVIPATDKEDAKLPAPLMGTGSSTKLNFDEAYQEALKDLIHKWKPTLLESREISLYRQQVVYMGLVLGAPTFKLTVTLIAPERTKS